MRDLFAFEVPVDSFGEHVRVIAPNDITPAEARRVTAIVGKVLGIVAECEHRWVELSPTGGVPWCERCGELAPNVRAADLLALQRSDNRDPQ